MRWTAAIASMSEEENEEEMTQESLSHEHSRSAEIIRKLQLDVKSLIEARLEDKKYIEMLERELKNCSQEIGYLQDEINLRNVEANCMGEHVHSLELKLSKAGKLRETVNELKEELDRSGSDCLLLKHALQDKEMELQNSVSRIEKLETTISSIALESQCEVESLKLDLMNMEQRYLEMKKINEEAAKKKVGMNVMIEELGTQLKETEQIVYHLEDENLELQQKMMETEKNVKMFYEKLEEYLEKLFRCSNESVSGFSIVSHQPFHTKLESRLASLEQTCNPDLLGPLLSKLSRTRICEGNLKEQEMQKASIQIRESEHLVKQLKEELQEEKARSKEEAEELIQEMAELRYQMKEMLEQECKRRSSIEQVSLKRIAELEAQVRKEQRETFVAVRRCHEIQQLAEDRLAELLHLNSSLKGIGPYGRQLQAISQKNEACSCGRCSFSTSTSTSDEIHVGGEISGGAGTEVKNLQAIAWYSEETDVSEQL